MSPHNYHLAQLNVARMLEPLESPVMQEFVDGLAPINALAEKSKGFVWRLKDEDAPTAATSYRPFEDDLIIINMSVWEDVESLRDFAFSPDHVAYVKRRGDWFRRMKEAYVVMWWVKEGHRPNAAEALARLKFLRLKGETSKAFSFRKIFPAPEN